MKKRTLSILLAGSILLSLFLTFQKAEAENWIQYFKVGDDIWYYDKDSIYYPDKRNENVVRVWTKSGSKGFY